MLTRGHHAVLPFREGTGVTILTACRSSEVRWEEIDLDNAVLGRSSRPHEGRQGGHRVPLSDRAVAILSALKEARISDFVFPGNEEFDRLIETLDGMSTYRNDLRANKRCKALR